MDTTTHSTTTDYHLPDGLKDTLTVNQTFPASLQVSPAFLGDSLVCAAAEAWLADGHPLWTTPITLLPG